MKKLLNTLYVTTQGASLRKERETIRITIEKQQVHIPIHTLDSVCCFGNIYVSPYLLGALAESGVLVSYMTEYGKFLARVEGKKRGNVLLRRAQYRAVDSEEASSVVASMLQAKIANSRSVLMRYLRDHGSADVVQGSACDEGGGQVQDERQALHERRVQDTDGQVQAVWRVQQSRDKRNVQPAQQAQQSQDASSTLAVKSATKELKRVLQSIQWNDSIETLRGKEGIAAKAYFSVFDILILKNKEDFYFHQRSKRPPKDPMNGVLSFLYTLLFHDTVSGLEAHGLDAAVGFLHTERSGRDSLALDLMEEFRSVICDRVALTLVNRGQLTKKDFQCQPTGAVFLNEKGRKTVIEAYQAKKREEVFHPFLQEKVPIGLLFYIQAQLLARYLRGMLDGYPAYFWR